MFFESLEQRQLRSVSLSDGVVSITGTSAADTISVYVENTTSGSGAISTTSPQLVISDNGVKTKYSLIGSMPFGWAGPAAAAVTQIDVELMNGADTFKALDIGHGMTTIPIYVNPGDGDDTVVTADGDDTVHASDGEDSIKGNAGADKLWGGQNDDIIKGNTGDDEIYGGSGTDLLHGDAGADCIGGGDDADTIAGGADADTAEGGEGNDSIRGGAGEDVLEGDAGDDEIHGEEDDDDVYGQAGKDELFGGDGIDLLDGGEDSDVLVSIGGKQADVLYGRGGLDSFWADSESSEKLEDDTTDERNTGRVHRVSGFMPYRFDGVSGVTPVSRDLNGQSLADPTILPSHDGTTSYQDFSDNPLFPSTGAKEDDIEQQQLNDCYFLAALSSVAGVNQNLIHQRAVSLGDGTYAVQFYEDGDEVFVRVDGDLPATSSGTLRYADRGTDNAIWVAIMEKAWCFFREDAGSYESIEWGSPTGVYDALGMANDRETSFSSSVDLYEHIEDALDSGKAVTLCTDDESEFIVGNHCYQVVRVDIDSSGQRVVRLRNPWASDGSGGDSTDDGYLWVLASSLIADTSSVVSAW